MSAQLNRLLRTVALLILGVVVEGVGSQYESTLLDDLQAECTQEGISVKLYFKQPFSGVAYSHGHYETPKCRYISHEDELIKPSGTNFSFLIPINECGTVYHGGLGTPLRRLRNTRDTKTNENEVYIENTLLVQNDPMIQEAGDLAKTLRCVWQKEIHKPLVASLPFGNVNSKSQNPTRFAAEKVGATPSRNKTNFSSTGHKGRLRFQMKGQVQSVPAFRRYHSRSLPFGDEDRRSSAGTEVATTTEVFRDEENDASGISALALEGKPSIGTTSGGLSTLGQGGLNYRNFWLMVTIRFIGFVLKGC